MEDIRIIELYNNRDEHAISETADRYSALLKSISRNILGSELDAEECVNDTYLQAWSSIPPNRPDSLSAYLVSIVRNISVNRYKKLNAQKRGSDKYALSLDELEGYICTDINFDEGDVSRIISEFLRGEKQVYKAMFVRRYYFCESFAEIADTIGVKESTVRMGLSRVRKRLREHLRREGINV